MPPWNGRILISFIKERKISPDCSSKNRDIVHSFFFSKSLIILRKKFRQVLQQKASSSTPTKSFVKSSNMGGLQMDIRSQGTETKEILFSKPCRQIAVREHRVFFFWNSNGPNHRFGWPYHFPVLVSFSILDL